MQELPQSNASNSPQLSEEEASQLATELKLQLRNGQVPLASAELIKLMVAGLGDRRGLMRLTFAESLGAVGYAAVPYLCQALKPNNNVTVRRAAAKTLTLIGDSSALPALLDALLNDDDPVVQGSAVGAMAAVGDAAVETLLGVLTNPETTAMQLGLASWGLAFVGARAPEALRNAAKSLHPEVRTAAIAALGDQIQSQADIEARELVVQALDDDSSDVRAEASTLLGKLHDLEWALPLLTPKLGDNNSQVRKNAALSIMKLEAHDAIPILKEYEAKESDENVRIVFRLAINQLSR